MTQSWEQFLILWSIGKHIKEYIFSTLIDII
jgi:hypothetical protein